MAGCAALAALVAVEAAVRVVAPAYDPRGRVGFTVLADGTPIGPRSQVTRQIANTGDFDVQVRFNELGFRDAKRVDQADGDSLFVVGDSFAFGWGVDESERFSNRLEALLGRPVFNIAEGATDLDGYDRLLRYAEAHGARIQTLIVAVCMENDLRDYGPDQAERSPLGTVSAVKVFLTEHSAAYGLAATAIHRSPWLERAAAGTGFVTPGLVAAAGLDPPAEAIASSAVRLQRLVDGRRALVLLVPSRGLWAGTGEQRGRARRAHDRFAGLLRESGVRVVDVRALFEQADDPLRLYFPHDGHWTSEGHRIAAEALSDAVASEPPAWQREDGAPAGRAKRPGRR